MAPRPAGRPKAADISDLDMLEACAKYTQVGAPFPSERFLSSFPAKVVQMKLVKLERRGFINARRHMTREGIEAMAKLQDEVTV